MTKQLVTAYVLVTCEDWMEAEVLVASALNEALLEVQAVKWEETVEEEDDDYTFGDSTT